MKKVELMLLILMVYLSGCSLVGTSYSKYQCEKYPSLLIEAIYDKSTFETKVNLYDEDVLVSSKVYERLNITQGISYFQIKDLKEDFKLEDIEDVNFKRFKNINIKLDNNEKTFEIIDYIYYGENSADYWILNDKGRIEGISTIGDDHEYSVVFKKEYNILHSLDNKIEHTDIEYQVFLFLYEENKVYHQIYLTRNQEETEFKFCLEYIDKYGVGREVTNYIYMIKIVEENQITFQAIKNEEI